MSNKFILFLKQKRSMSASTFILVMATYFAFVLNQPVINRMFELSENVSDVWFPFTAPFLLLFTFIILFSFFTIPYLTKPVMIVITFTSAIALYASKNYHILFDTSMIENVFETDSSEALSYLNPTSITAIFIYGFIPSVLIALVKFKQNTPIYKSIIQRFLLISFAIVGILIIAATSYKDYASVGRNNHYLNKMIIPSHIFNTIDYVNKKYITTPLKYINYGDDATLLTSNNNKPTLMVLVLGETARAMNFHYNGYERNTNRYTQDLGLIALQNVSSCGTYTARSVPCMFSNLNRSEYNKARINAQDNVVDIIKKSGVETLWIDNDGGDKGVAKKTDLIKVDANKQDEDCNGKTCYDSIMLDYAKQFIDKDNENKFIVLHSIGSHGPTYWQRYPEKIKAFSPSCERSDIENCSDEAIVNVYDNTLLYTDYILAKVINELKQYTDDYNVAMMYISDHGESLGELGLYLHGTPYAIAPKEQTTVPWLIWMPEQYAQQKQIDSTCLANKANQSGISHDNFFHTLLGFYGIETVDKNKQLDLTASCKLQATDVMAKNQKNDTITASRNLEQS